jgi:hypothetical protein
MALSRYSGSDTYRGEGRFRNLWHAREVSSSINTDTSDR